MRIPRSGIRASASAAILAMAAGVAFGEDWPQWFGPARNGHSAEAISVDWPAAGPKVLWQADVGMGHAPVSVVAGRAVTLGFANKLDTVWCFDANAGRVLWRFDYPAVGHFGKNEWGAGKCDGPHAAPAIADGNVFTLSRDGKVHCLALANGNCRWSRDLTADLKAKLPECGFAGSPLLMGRAVVVNVGTYGTALDCASGRTLWTTGTQIAGYAAPVFHADAAGKRRLLMFAFADLAAVDPCDGRVMWEFRWPTRFGANVADPLVLDGNVFFTSAYNRGCGAVDLATGKPRWQNRSVNSQCSPVILHERKIYGFDGYINDGRDKQALVCLDPNGREVWRRPGPCGQMILTGGGKLLMLLTTGELVAAAASPKAYEELARARVQPAEECPVPPALANGRLFCRTGKGRVVCLEVKKK
jgi:outer membrane protein assembly factor BamB